MSVFLRPNSKISPDFSTMLFVLLDVNSFDSFGNYVSFVGPMIKTSTFLFILFCFSDRVCLCSPVSSYQTGLQLIDTPSSGSKC